MPNDKELTTEAMENVSDAPQQLAMVYRNEFNEVSHMPQTDKETVPVGGGLSNIVLIFVLTLIALVTISRRPVKSR